jgi:transposase-like protein
MDCRRCQGQTKRFGKDRNGNQRYRCLSCGKVSVDQPKRLLGDMILAEEKALVVLQHLVEGCSIRSTSRITGVHPKTILNLLTPGGERCERLMEHQIKGLVVEDVQCDEFWGFVGM